MVSFDLNTLALSSCSEAKATYGQSDTLESHSAPPTTRSVTSYPRHTLLKLDTSGNNDVARSSTSTGVIRVQSRLPHPKWKLPGDWEGKTGKRNMGLSFLLSRDKLMVTRPLLHLGGNGGEGGAGGAGGAGGVLIPSYNDRIRSKPSVLFYRTI